MKKWIWVLLGFALIFRAYRVDELTGFYFDQGRDAKVVWDLWHSGKFFLIGPTTGIEGIFLGPFYYYLIAPFYLLGGGHPAFPAVALALINIAGIYVIYQIGKKYFHPHAGILAALFIAFSVQLTKDHRWLSNPTPLPLFSALAVLLIFQLISGSKKPITWLALGLILGLSLQLEAASAIFFLPATAIIFLIFRKQIIWGLGPLHLLFSFLITLIPQLWFNFRHENILFKAFERFLVTDKSFTPVLSNFYSQRLSFYFESFSQKLFSDTAWTVMLLGILALALIFFKKVFTKNFLVILVWLTIPLISLLFYHGNNGYVWSYYFTGIYPFFILAVAWILAVFFSSRFYFSRGMVGLFVAVFLISNIHQQVGFLFKDSSEIKDINLGNSLKIVDWVYQDAANKPFNVDVYVPPVIPHSYDYLFLWRGNTRYKTLPSQNTTPLLYLVYESDVQHPERLEAWMRRQETIAKSNNLVKYGGVTVEKSFRLDHNEI